MAGAQIGAKAAIAFHSLGGGNRRLPIGPMNDTHKRNKLEASAIEPSLKESKWSLLLFVLAAISGRDSRLVFVLRPNSFIILATPDPRVGARELESLRVAQVPLRNKLKQDP